MVGFYDWMITNYIDDNSPIGDLAHDIKRDDDFPRNGGLREMYEYMESRDNTVLGVFVRAYANYLEYGISPGTHVYNIPNREDYIKEHIKHLIESKGSILGFCRSSGVSAPAIYNILNGKYNMSLSKFLWFCDALRCNPSEVLGEADCYSPLTIDNTKLTGIYPYNLAKAVLQCKDSELHQIDGASLIVVMKGSLTERESDAIEMKFRFHMTLEECGKKWDVSRERIRQVVAKGLRKLRHPSRLRLYKLVPLRTIKDIERQNSILINENEKLKLKLGLTKIEDSIDFDLADLDMSVRAYNCLVRNGFKRISDARKMSLCDLCRIRNIGIKTFEEIVIKLREYGVILIFHKQCDKQGCNCKAKNVTHKLYGSIDNYELSQCEKKSNEGTEDYE